MSTRSPAARLWMLELRATLTLAWPLILTNVAQMAMTATDVMMMGWLGPRSLAAGALGNNLYTAVLIFGIGVMAAVPPMIAIERGRNRHAVREVRRTVRQGMWVAFTLVGPMWLLLWQAEPILLALGQDPELSREASAYVRAVQWSLLPFYLYLVLRGFVAALERPLWSTIVVVGAVAFNALADWVLIFGHWGFPALGVTGAGIATVASSTLMALGLGLVVVRHRRFRRYRVFGRFWVADWPRYRAFWALGLPIGAAVAFEVVIFNAAALLMGAIGADALAAHAIAIQIAALSFMVPMGIGQAGTVRVGRAAGAGDAQGVMRAGAATIGLSLAFMAMMAMVMLFAPGILIVPFLDLRQPGVPAVAALAVTFLFYAAIFQLADGAQVAGASVLRGLGDAKVPMVYAGLGYWASACRSLPGSGSGRPGAAAACGSGWLPG